MISKPLSQCGRSYAPFVANIYYKLEAGHDLKAKAHHVQNRPLLPSLLHKAPDIFAQKAMLRMCQTYMLWHFFSSFIFLATLSGWILLHRWVELTPALSWSPCTKPCTTATPLPCMAHLCFISHPLTREEAPQGGLPEWASVMIKQLCDSSLGSLLSPFFVVRIRFCSRAHWPPFSS